MTKRLDRSLVAETALLAAATLLYTGTMARSIAVGDAGELALAASVVGIPHPPGYPLYTLLARLAFVVPLEPVALRFNLLSVACAIGALFVHLRLGAALGLSLVPRLAATALLAGSYTFWSQAAIAEVYALHVLLVNAVLLVAVVALREGRESADYPRLLLLLAYLIGTSAAHHPSAALLTIVGLVVWVATRGWGARNGAVLAGLAPLAAALPFTIFLMLPLRSRLDPAIDWGNPETLAAAIAHAARSGYGDLREFGRPLSLFAGQVAAVARFLADDLSLPLACAAPAGLLLLFLRGPLYTRLPLAFFVISAMGTILLVNFPLTGLALYDNRVFFLASVSLAAIGCGACFEMIHSALVRSAPAVERSSRSSDPASTSARRGGAARFARIAVPALVLALAIIPALRRIPRLDRREHTVAEDLGRALLIAIDPGATLLASEGQAVHSLAYVSGVLGYRADVRVVDRLGVLGGGRGIGGRALPAGRERSEAIFATDAEPLRARGLAAIPWGLAYRGGSPETAVSPGVWESLTFRRPDKLAAIDFAERDVLVGAYVRMAEHVSWAGLKVRGQDALREARRLAGDEAPRRFAIDFAVAYERVGLPDSARAYWAHAVVSAPPGDPGPYRGAGLAAGRAGRWEEARTHLESAARIRPADADILVELGSARLAVGDSSGARAAWRTALDARPDHREARRGLIMLGDSL
jgi:Protein of unknown function (DUF2723)